MTRLPNGDHDFTEAVESLIAIHNGQPGRPPLHYPAPLQPRSVPPVRTLRNPAPRRPWGADLAAVTRRRRVLDALARMRRAA